MNYYIDTEFLEGKQKEKFPISLFRKETPPTIDLISIGIVSEDNREYYAISKDFNLKEAWNRYDLKLPEEMGDEPIKVYWIRENVLKPIFYELLVKDRRMNKELCLQYKEVIENKMTYSWLEELIKKYGKTNKQIADEIVKFIYPNALYGSIECNHNNLVLPNCADSEKPKFYAYFADYDWVVFCWLFGKMIDLPKGFPMYCIDLKQMLDEKAYKLLEIEKKYIDPLTLESGLDIIKHMPTYPKQTNEHSAIHDARWNKELHEFLVKLR